MVEQTGAGVGLVVTGSGDVLGLPHDISYLRGSSYFVPAIVLDDGFVVGFVGSRSWGLVGGEGLLFAAGEDQGTGGVLFLIGWRGTFREL